MLEVPIQKFGRNLPKRAIASEEKSDPGKIEGKLDDMVKKSMEKYPPRK